MSDPLLFIFGCVVTLLAGAGAFLFVYGRFRAEYARQNRLALRVGPHDSRLARAASSDVPAGPAGSGPRGA